LVTPTPAKSAGTAIRWPARIAPAWPLLVLVLASFLRPTPFCAWRGQRAGSCGPGQAGGRADELAGRVVDAGFGGPAADRQPDRG
jgi:hypothetical protein